DTVDGAGAGAVMALRDRALDVDHPGGLVEVRAAGRAARERERLVPAGILAGRRDDRRDLRAVRGHDRGVDRVVLDVVDADQAVDRAAPVETPRPGVRVRGAV